MKPADAARDAVRGASAEKDLADAQGGAELGLVAADDASYFAAWWVRRDGEARTFRAAGGPARDLLPGLLPAIAMAGMNNDIPIGGAS